MCQQHVPEVLDDALQWLQRTGEPGICKQVLELGSKEICFVAIQYIFAEYAHFIQSMGVNTEAMVKALTVFHVVGDVKGHYRYCEALFYLKEHKRAMESNAFAQMVCTQTTDCWKELCHQQNRFIIEMMEKGVKEGQPPAASNTKHPKQEKSETDKSKKEGLKASATNKSKNDKDRSHEKTVPRSTRVSPSVCTVALRVTVLEGSGALADLRFTLAEKAFSQALSMLQSTTPKDLGITTLDEALLHYGRASALIEIGQPQELGEALREFAIITSFEKRTFECLVYYGIGRVYLKENRFRNALARFMDSMQMVNKQITPGKLTWPLTKEIVKETQLDYFKFETVITKPERPKKLRVNQKCTSLKKLKSKEAWRLRRKQGKQVSKEATSAEGHPRPEDQGATAARPDKHSEQQGPGTLPLHRDRVLFQIRKNRGDLQEHLCPDLGVLVARLRPWVELDCSRDDTAAAGGFLERLRVETLGQLVDLLLERGNRVWARIF
ncbi:hypothetical protein CRUP_013601, partial [Coryphaenoides rupestris]